LLASGLLNFEEVILATIVVLAGVANSALASLLVPHDALTVLIEVGVTGELSGSAGSG
jgi:hypothetical protein